MQSIIRYGLAVLIGGLIVGGVLIAGGVNAQDPQADAESEAPMVIDNVQLDGQFLQYQGQLLDPFTGAPVANGSYQMVFRMYNVPTGGSAFWQESKLVDVTDGLFTTLLGDTTSFNLDDFNGQRLYLGTEINGNGETAPRMPIASNAYAFHAANSELLGNRTADSFADKKRQTIAYGVVNSDGGREKGWNFSGLGYDSNKRVFFISIDNVDYKYQDYITVVTPIVNSVCQNPAIAGTGSDGGRLAVSLERRDGSSVQCWFHFVTYAP